MALVKPSSIQRHPLGWGLLWAGLSFALVCLIQYVLGRPLPNLLIALPVWAVAGAIWGYWMKRYYDRKAGEGAQ
jgi:hypothetical protein